MSDASDRLARSRLAIIEQLQSRDQRAGRRGTERPRRERANAREQGPADDESDAGGPWTFGRGEGLKGWMGGASYALRTWWRHHPAHMAVELATPMLSSYARSKPAQFLAISAALGAVVVVARPWRVLTAGGVIAALLKSSQVSGLLLSALSAANFEKDHRRPNE